MTTTARGVFFKDQGGSIIGDDAHLGKTPFRPVFNQAVHKEGAHEVKLLANTFKLTMLPSGSVHQHSYTLTPAAASPREEQWVLQQLWCRLQESLGAFVVHFPGFLFSPKALDKDLSLETQADAKQNFVAHKVVVKKDRSFTAAEINSSTCGEAQVVLQHVVKRLAGGLKYQKVGRRYYNNIDALQGQGSKSMAIFAGFEMAVQMGKAGARVVIDTSNRAFLRDQNVLQTMITRLGEETPAVYASAMPLGVQQEWLSRCSGATVVTKYNSRAYRIKDIHFDKRVTGSFSYYTREEKARTDMTFVDFYNTFYNLRIEHLDQPLLEAYSEKDSEKVYLVPELCLLTGVTSEMRQNWTKAEDKEALDALKVKPGDRLASIKELANNMVAGGKGKVLEEWKMSLETEPTEVSAHTMEPLEVDLGSKKFLIEDGNFQRWMRNGVQAASTLSDWLLLFTERDTQVLDIWLRSLKDIAEVAFQMKLEFPQKVVCTDQLDPETGAVAQLKQRVTTNTQLVLLLSPSNIINRVYDEVKSAVTGMDSELPVMTQIVSSETIRKRSQIASVLSCIALQVNAKCCGPLWQIQLEHKLTEPFFATATMVIGVDVYTAYDGGKWLGIVASLDTHCTEYWSMAYKLDGQDVRRSISQKLQEAMKNSFGTFSQRNNRVVPDHILIYRCSVRLSEEEAVVATEVKAVLGFLGDVNAARQGEQYSPKLTFVAVTNSEGVRFFRPTETGSKCTNPDLGTVVDCPSVSRSSAVNFWLINQTASKGTVAPSHYTVWYDSANTPPSALQHVTHRLSFLYFNIWMSVRLPAPAMYAKKLAKFIGKHVKQPPHRRFVTSLFYL